MVYTAENRLTQGQCFQIARQMGDFYRGKPYGPIHMHRYWYNGHVFQGSVN